MTSCGCRGTSLTHDRQKVSTCTLVGAILCIDLCKHPLKNYQLSTEIKNKSERCLCQTSKLICGFITFLKPHQRWNRFARVVLCLLRRFRENPSNCWTLCPLYCLYCKVGPCGHIWMWIHSTAVMQQLVTWPVYSLKDDTLFLPLICTPTWLSSWNLGSCLDVYVHSNRVSYPLSTCCYNQTL